VYLQDINIRRKEEILCKFKIGHLEEIMSLKLAIHMKNCHESLTLEESAQHRFSLSWQFLGASSEFV
jgi:hypothetical protein